MRPLLYKLEEYRNIINLSDKKGRNGDILSIMSKNIELINKYIHILENPHLLKEGDRKTINDKSKEISSETDKLFQEFNSDPDNVCYKNIYSNYKNRNNRYRNNPKSLCMARTWNNGCGTPCKRPSPDDSDYCFQHSNIQRFGKITRKRPHKDIKKTNLNWKKNTMIEEIKAKGDILKPVFNNLPNIPKKVIIEGLEKEYTENIMTFLLDIDKRNKLRKDKDGRRSARFQCQST